MLYLKLALSNLSNSKISNKNEECLNLVTRMPYLNIFGLEFENNIVMFEISTLKFV